MKAGAISSDMYQARIKKLQENSFWERCRGAQKIELKANTQVMLLKNLDFSEEGSMLVNGSRY